MLTIPGGLVRAVLPHRERLDLGEVPTILETNDVQLATEE